MRTIFLLTRAHFKNFILYIPSKEEKLILEILENSLTKLEHIIAKQIIITNGIIHLNPETIKREKLETGPGYAFHCKKKVENSHLH